MGNSIKAVYVLALSLVLACLQVCAQSELDSLVNQLEETDADEQKINLLLQITKVGTEAYDMVEYANQARELSKKINDRSLEAKSLLQVGRWNTHLENFDSARSAISTAIELFKFLDDVKYQAKSTSYLAYLNEKMHQYDSANYYYKKAIAKALTIEDSSGYALYNLHLGDMENIRGNNHEALQYIRAANEYFDRPLRKDSAWISLNSLAIVYDEMGLYPEALGYYLKAFEIIQELDDQDGKIILANNLGTIYSQLGKQDKAKDYYSRGLEWARIKNLKEDEALLLNNLSILYVEEGDTIQAAALLRKAHKLQEESQLQNCDLAYTSEGLGEVMTWQKKYDSAHYFFNQALKWAKECEMQGSLTSIYRNMGLLAIKQKRYGQAEAHLKRSMELGIKASYGSELKETAKELFNFYNNRNDVRNALEYHLIYSSIKDSLFNAESTEQIARMTAEYDFRREIESLEYKKMADEMRLNEKLRQKEAYQNSILVVLILTTLLAASLGRSYYLLQNHNKKLKALNEEKNTLMGVVAHDLRSPLNNIKGLMALVKMENSSLSPEQSHYFHLVDDTMERMRDMIDRVLDVSVVEDMKVNLNLKKVDLGQTMNFVASNFELLAEKKSIRIHGDLDTKTHYIFADYNYLLQVIENLLSNAIKFSEPGKNIYLNIFQEDGSETMVIRDEGPGISEEDRKMLFNKFQKLSAKPTDNEKSTGLGLSIVKKFVDAMEAEILCESELGKGTSFIVKFKTAIEQELVQ